MKETIEITNISFSSLFKLFYFGMFPVVMCFSMLVLVGVLSGGAPENPEPNQLYGWQAVVAALFLGICWPLVAGFFLLRLESLA